MVRLREFMFIGKFLPSLKVTSTKQGTKEEKKVIWVFERTISDGLFTWRRRASALFPGEHEQSMNSTGDRYFGWNWPREKERHATEEFHLICAPDFSGVHALMIDPLTIEVEFRVVFLHHPTCKSNHCWVQEKGNEKKKLSLSCSLMFLRRGKNDCEGKWSKPQAKILPLRYRQDFSEHPRI